MDEIKLVAFHTSTKLHNDLKALCASLNMSIRNFMNKIVREAVEKYKKK